MKKITKQSIYTMLICFFVFAGTVKTNAQGCWKTISAGGEYTVAIKTNGTLWTWGRNLEGELGDGTNVLKRNAPVQIGTATNWASVSAGYEHVVAIKTDGTLWAWGFNTSGQLGIGTISTSENTPMQVGTATNWASASAGRRHTVAIKADGSLWAWGVSPFGELGLGASTTNVFSPMQVGTATNWASVSTKYDHNVALKTDGTLWAWGSNEYGQLGNGYIPSPNISGDQYVPVQIGTSNNWATAKAGYYHSLAIKTNGTLWAWGYNSNGQLGDFSTVDKSSPEQIGTATNWAKVTGGTFHSVAIKTNGTLWAWGDNESGQLGNGSIVDKNSPVQIGGTNWSSTSEGYGHTVAIKTDGTGWSWGSNQYNGQLGNGTYTDKYVPTSIAPGSISGALSICRGTTTTLTNAVSGGSWSTSSSSLLTINANTGFVAGVYQGTGFVTYTVAGCGSIIQPIVVYPYAATPQIAPAPSTPNPQNGPGGTFCLIKAGQPNSFTLIGNPNNGSWSSNNNNLITITPTGVVTLVAPGGPVTLTYAYTNLNGCNASKSVPGIVVGNCSVARGVKNEQLIIDNGQFTIYPNPARSTVSLQVEKLVGSGTIVVTDLYGKQVKVQALSMGTNTIDISNLAKGFYLVSTITEQGKTTKKLVVE